MLYGPFTYEKVIEIAYELSQLTIVNQCSFQFLQFYLSMFKSKKNITILALVLLVSAIIYFQGDEEGTQISTQRLLTSYATTTTRTNSVNSFCGSLSRTSLLTSSQMSAYSMYNTQMQSMFTIDGNTLIYNVLSGNTGTATSSLQSSVGQIAAFIGPFVLGLIALLAVSPFLCCCCTCPHCCPAKCCRKSEQEQYNKCQLYCPTITLVLALLLSIGACIAGFSQSQIINTSLDSMSCAASIVLDDLMNGNVTTDGTSFFAGLNQIKTQLGYLNGNLTAINTTMANLIPTSTNITNTLSDATTALTAVAKIPANVNSGGNMNDIVYNTPFNSASTTGTINSIFPSLLGSSTTGGYVGALYTLLTTAKTSISSIATAAQNFNTEASNFQSGVSTLQSTITSFNNFLSNADNGSYSYMSDLTSKKPLINLGVQLVYGITIGIASLMLIGTLLVAFCDKTGCRYLMYFSCVLLFLIGIVGFMMTIIFSIVTPAIYFSCQFISYSLASTSNFNSNFQNIISDSNYRSYITSCLPTSTGDLMSAFGGTAVNAIKNLSLALTDMNSFNTTYQASIILSAMTEVTSYISNYQTGVILDISDTSSFSILNSLSMASSYSSCSATGFTSDSWTPSNSQNPVYIACQISSGNQASSSSCSGGVSSRSGSCNGCMDTTSTLSSYSSKATLLSNLGTRYSGCTTFNNDLANTWSNYFYVKSQAYAPVSSRASTANTNVNTFTSDLTGTINTTFTNAQSSLSSASSTVTDPTYGLVAGLNCKLIGEDIQLASTAFCQSLFTISYFTRLVLGLTSFGILFSLCCGVCTGVRFMKHDIRKLNSANNQGISDVEVEDITNTNFVKPKALQ